MQREIENSGAKERRERRREERGGEKREERRAQHLADECSRIPSKLNKAKSIKHKT
jgi:hypothetical protein